MKKNTGKFYDYYKRNKVALDVIAPVILGMLGMLLGFYVKEKLAEFKMGDVIPSALIAGLTALPIGVYNKLILSYAAQIQEDKDYDELEKKNVQLKSVRKKNVEHKKAIAKLKEEKVKTYDAHDKLSRDIKRFLNGKEIDSDVRIRICELLDNGNGDLFKLTIQFDLIDINDDEEDEEYGNDITYDQSNVIVDIPIN